MSDVKLFKVEATFSPAGFEVLVDGRVFLSVGPPVDPAGSPLVSWSDGVIRLSMTGPLVSPAPVLTAGDQLRRAADAEFKSVTPNFDAFRAELATAGVDVTKCLTDQVDEVTSRAALLNGWLTQVGVTVTDGVDPVKSVRHAVDFQEEVRRRTEDRRLEAEYQAKLQVECDAYVRNRVVESKFYDKVLGEPYSTPHASTVSFGGYELTPTEYESIDTLVVGRPVQPTAVVGSGLFQRADPGDPTAIEVAAADLDGWKCVMPAKYPLFDDAGMQVGWSDGTAYAPPALEPPPGADEADEPISVVWRGDSR